MLIYTVMLEAAPGQARKLGPEVAGLRDVLTAATGNDWAAWAVVHGATFGTFVVSCRVESFAQLAEGQMKAASSAAFAAATESYSPLMSKPAQHFVREVIARTGAPVVTPKPFMVVTQVTMAGGHFRDALAWSTKIMQHVTDVTGVDGAVAVATAGSINEISWLSGLDSPAHIDEFAGKVNADATYMEMVDDAGDYFVPGSAQRMIIAALP